MNTTKLEQISITKLRDAIDRCENLIHEIKENDKTPSWDGEIRAYHSDNSRVNELIGTARVQVKSKCIKNSSKLLECKIKHTVRTSDLRNYLNEGGTIYFVIQIYNSDQYAIYYNNLLPLDISDYLKNINIEFYKLDYSDNTLIKQLVLNFISDRQKQFSTYKMRTLNNIDFKNINSKFDKFSFSVSGAKDPFEYMLNNRIYLYGDIENVSIPLHKVWTELISTKLPEKVSIDGTLYYEEITIIKNKQEELIKFGNCFELSSLNQKITFKIIGDVECRLKAMSFLDHLSQCNKIDIGSDYYIIDRDILNNKEQFNINYQELKDIKETLMYFNSRETLELDNINDSDIKNLTFIINAYKNKGIVKLNQSITSNISDLKIDTFRFFRIEISNINLLLKIVRLNKYNYKVENGFKRYHENECLCIEDESDSISVFCLFGENDFTNISNVDYKILIEDLKKFPLTDSYITNLIYLLLEMLHSYNISKDEDLLNACEEVSLYLYNNDTSNTINILNYFQCIKRKRNLTNEENVILYDIRNIESEDIFLLGVSILLENKNDIKYYFSKLTEEQKEEFLSFPIANLTDEIGVI